jgi:hypothetical protein
MCWGLLVPKGCTPYPFYKLIRVCITCCFSENNYKGDLRLMSYAWAHRWQAAIKAIRYHATWDYHVIGLNMSRAFDTIDRIGSIDEYIARWGWPRHEDELRMCKVLLVDRRHTVTHMHLTVKTKRGDIVSPFVNTIGTPQLPLGDGLYLLFDLHVSSLLWPDRAIRHIWEALAALPPRPVHHAILN